MAAAAAAGNGGAGVLCVVAGGRLVGAKLAVGVRMRTWWEEEEEGEPRVGAGRIPQQSRHGIRTVLTYCGRPNLTEVGGKKAPTV